jgi:NAD(P)-dependent dehydrogenase (short-subunit alcohol dehydrogenase family)
VQNRNILITNVSSFVGKPGCQALLEGGARVMAHDRSFTDAAARAVFEADLPGASALTAQTAEEVIAEAEAIAPVDVLINNDDGEAKRAKVEDADPADLRDALESMVVWPFVLTGAMVPAMKARKSGKIIFVTSATPLKGLPNYAMYVTARGATNSLALSLAHELARHNIQVNALAPNFVESPAYFPKELTENPETLAKITKNIPLGRLAQPEEVGKVLAFLAGDGSDFITGLVMPYAGGWA